MLLSVTADTRQNTKLCKYMKKLINKEENTAQLFFCYLTGIKLIPRISHFVNKYHYVCCNTFLCLEKEKNNYSHKTFKKILEDKSTRIKFFLNTSQMHS